MSKKVRDTCGIMTTKLESKITTFSPLKKGLSGIPYIQSFTGLKSNKSYQSRLTPKVYLEHLTFKGTGLKSNNSYQSRLPPRGLVGIFHQSD